MPGRQLLIASWSVFLTDTLEVNRLVHLFPITFWKFDCKLATSNCHQSDNCGSKRLCNVGERLPGYMAQYRGRQPTFVLSSVRA